MLLVLSLVACLNTPSRYTPVRPLTTLNVSIKSPRNLHSSIKYTFRSLGLLAHYLPPCPSTIPAAGRRTTSREATSFLRNGAHVCMQYPNCYLDIFFRGGRDASGLQQDTANRSLKSSPLGPFSPIIVCGRDCPWVLSPLGRTS